MLELSDVISFHYYGKPDQPELISFLKSYSDKRPILCTEWLHRQSGNTYETVLPVFREYGVGWYQWGLVAGRTQTYFHWDSQPGTPEPDIWQHDLFRADGTPYDETELRWIRGEGV